MDGREPTRGRRSDDQRGAAKGIGPDERRASRGWVTPADPKTTTPSAPAGFADTRRETRVPLNVPVRLATIDPETDPNSGRPFFRSVRELCANVSRNGLFVRTSEPLEPGRRLLVDLELPGGSTVEAVGRVAWIKKSLASDDEHGVGIELIGGNRLASLQAFVSARDRRPRGSDETSTVG